MYAASCAENGVRDGMSACHAAPASAREAHSVYTLSRMPVQPARCAWVMRYPHWVFIGSVSTRRRWPSGADCRRRTHASYATAVVPAAGPSPDVETAVQKGEMSERRYHSRLPSSAERPPRSPRLFFAVCFSPPLTLQCANEIKEKVAVREAVTRDVLDRQ